MDENQVPVETTEPPTKRTKLDEVEKSVMEILEAIYKGTISISVIGVEWEAVYIAVTLNTGLRG